MVLKQWVKEDDVLSQGTRGKLIWDQMNTFLTDVGGGGNKQLLNNIQKKRLSWLGQNMRHWGLVLKIQTEGQEKKRACKQLHMTRMWGHWNSSICWAEAYGWSQRTVEWHVHMVYSSLQTDYLNDDDDEQNVTILFIHLILQAMCTIWWNFTFRALWHTQN